MKPNKKEKNQNINVVVRCRFVKVLSKSPNFMDIILPQFIFSHWFFFLCFFPYIDKLFDHKTYATLSYITIKYQKVATIVVSYSTIIT